MTHSFYGDVFKIEDIGCLFFGHGKTKAGKTAINDNQENEISLDMARIDRLDNIVYGSGDMLLALLQTNGAEFLKSSPMFKPDVVDKYIKGISPIPNKNTQIQLLIRCLDEEETKDEFDNSGIFVKEVGYDIFTNLSLFNIGFMNSPDALQKFVLLTQDSSIKKCVLVPWMDSHIEKGELIKTYVINNF